MTIFREIADHWVGGVVPYVVVWDRKPIGLFLLYAIPAAFGVEVVRVPVRVDYSDYRTVSGVKLPFKWVTTWTDGRTVFQLDSVQLNTTVDPMRFAKPKPPVAPKR